VYARVRVRTHLLDPPEIFSAPSPARMLACARTHLLHLQPLPHRGVGLPVVGQQPSKRIGRAVRQVVLLLAQITAQGGLS
jgi:hypothetical protein